MSKKTLFIAILSSIATSAFAQNAVTQFGTPVVQRPAKWIQPRQLGDAGGLAGDVAGLGLAPFSITDNNGLGLCFNTAATTGTHNTFCWGHNTAGQPVYSINGVVTTFPGTGLGDVVGPAVAGPTGHTVLWNGAKLTRGGGPPSMVSVMDQAYGAVCDGTTNDTAAINLALATGLPVTGNNRVCAVSGNIILPDNFNVNDIEFKQLAAANNTRTLIKTSGGTKGTLKNVKVNMNASGTVGTIGDAAGVWIAGINDVTIDGLEVYGGGKGYGLAVINGTRIITRNVYIRDLQWSNATDPGTEQIVGMFFSGNTHHIIENPRCKTLNGVIGAAAPRAYQTDCIGITGANHTTILGGSINNVGEGIDTAGSLASNSVWIIGTSLVDIDSYGIKFGSISDSGTIGVRVKDAGFAAFTVFTNGSTPSGLGPKRIRHIGASAINTGSNGLWGVTRAFDIQYSSNGTPSDVPTDITCDNCVARDGTSQMDYGFYVDAGASWNLINPSSTGHTGAWMRDSGVSKDLTAGAAIEPQYTTLINAGTVTFTTPMTKPIASMVIDAAGALASGTITLPACSADQYGPKAEYSPRFNITTVTVNAAGGAIVANPPSGLTAGIGNMYQCRAGIWHRMY